MLFSCVSILKFFSTSSNGQELLDRLTEERSRVELARIEPKAQGIYWRYRDGLSNVDVRDLAIHRRVSRLNYSRRCVEASAVNATKEADWARFALGFFNAPSSFRELVPIPLK
jgi:hypothetical protein